MVNSPQAGGYTRQGGLIRDIVSAVAEKTGDDPIAMTPPLGERVDVDALERFLLHSSNGANATFEYQGLSIRVESDGQFELQEATDGE